MTDRSDAAGALVDGAAGARGETPTLGAGWALGRADAGTFLEESGDPLHTGPTGTQVMGLLLGWKVKH